MVCHTFFRMLICHIDPWGLRSCFEKNGCLLQLYLFLMQFATFPIIAKSTCANGFTIQIVRCTAIDY